MKTLKKGNENSNPWLTSGEKSGRNAALFSAPNQSFMQVLLSLACDALHPYQFMHLLLSAVRCHAVYCIADSTLNAWFGR